MKGLVTKYFAIPSVNNILYHSFQPEVIIMETPVLPDVAEEPPIPPVGPLVQIPAVGPPAPIPPVPIPPVGQFPPLAVEAIENQVS